MSQEISSLSDLNNLRTAPELEDAQSKALREELSQRMTSADWFTVGIMAPSVNLAIFILREMESVLDWSPMKIASKPNEEGPVFLKANQKSGDIHIRIEYGLGEGILVGCQNNAEEKNADTLGLFPLDFFKLKI